MTDITDESLAAPRKPMLKRMLPIMLPVVALIAGGATTFMGLWSPMALIGGGAPEVEAHAASAVVFLDVPRIVLTVPGGGGRSVVMTTMIDIDPAQVAQAKALMPRVTDAFNTFLTDIDPSAFDRRGILEIIRAELATRARFVLGETTVRDLLITEFRIQ